MNKSLKIGMLAAFMIGSATLIGCGNKADKQTGNEAQTKTEVKAVQEANCFTTADDYLVSVIGKDYSQGDVCIPYAYVVSTDESNPDDILVWGDFWVFNYKLAGDTLKTVSGGNHPGLLHMKKTENGMEVTGFDAVEDGAGNMESAKKVFGDKFDAFCEINGNQEKREDMRLKFTAEYVKKHGMSVKALQDFGVPAVALPE